MKQFILTIVFTTLIVLLCIPGLVPLSPLQQLSIVCTLCFLQIGLTAFHFFTIKNSQQIPAVQFLDNQSANEEKSEAMLPDLKEVDSLGMFVNAVLAAYEKLPEDRRPPKDQLNDFMHELKIYQQCYIWVEKMQEHYGNAWNDKFQSADMPFDPAFYPELRSLIMEVALHTVDFCRYRTANINLTERMKVNPNMLLLGISVEKAGGKPINDNPFEIPKEVRLLHQLINEDGITLDGVTVHGFYYRNN